jgi:hypothetical protein
LICPSEEAIRDHDHKSVNQQSGGADEERFKLQQASIDPGGKSIESDDPAFTRKTILRPAKARRRRRGTCIRIARILGARSPFRIKDQKIRNPKFGSFRRKTDPRFARLDNRDCPHRDNQKRNGGANRTHQRDST